MRADVRAVRKQLEAVYQRLRDFAEQVGGHLEEFGKQLFGIHVVQEMLCEKVGLTPEEVKARIEAREAALAEQERLAREKAEPAHAEAMAEKERQQAARAETTEQPETPAEVADGQAPAQGADQHDQQG